MNHSHLLALALSSTLGLVTACSTELDARGDAGIEEGSSCEGFCGGEAPSGCFCDAECAANGDCCRDAEQVCTILEAEDCDDDHDGDNNDNNDNKVCFLGPERTNDVCFDVATPGNPSGYNYPSPLNGNYRSPVAYLDLDAVDSGTKIAPNFTLGEIAQRHKGRYAVVQPHAVARLQALRDAAGSIRVNSGYRNPSYNSNIGGATRSRHMYGDAFDLKPLGVSINSLESICSSNGGKLVEYNSHVHCDWRFDPQDTHFFGAAAVSGIEGPGEFELGFAASIQSDDGVFTAPAEGFDEGEPVRRWTAYDADGEVLAEFKGDEFTAPAGAHVIEVDVGRVVEVVQTIG